MKILLDIRHLTLKVPTLDEPILSDISYQIYEHDFVILLGSNGCGKSSLMKCIDNRYHPSSGEILLNGKRIRNPYDQGIITITQQHDESLFPSLTVIEHLHLMKSHQISNDYFINHLARFNDNLPHKLHQMVNELSGGEKQALILALVFLQPPKLLLLDEHTSALDPASSKKLMQITADMIAKHKITCLMTTHDLTIAHQYGNRVLSLHRGRISNVININEKSQLDSNALLALCYHSTG